MKGLGRVVFVSEGLQGHFSSNDLCLLFEATAIMQLNLLIYQCLLAVSTSIIMRYLQIFIFTCNTWTSLCHPYICTPQRRIHQCRKLLPLYKLCLTSLINVLMTSNLRRFTNLGAKHFILPRRSFAKLRVIRLEASLVKLRWSCSLVQADCLGSLESEPLCVFAEASLGFICSALNLLEARCYVIQ